MTILCAFSPRPPGPAGPSCHWQWPMIRRQQPWPQVLVCAMTAYFASFDSSVVFAAFVDSMLSASHARPARGPLPGRVRPAADGRAGPFRFRFKNEVSVLARKRFLIFVCKCLKCVKFSRGVMINLIFCGFIVARGMCQWINLSLHGKCTRITADIVCYSCT